MRIHRSNPDSRYLKVPQETIDDDRLSAGALGELVRLLSRPDGWETDSDKESRKARALRGKHGEGREAMRGLFRELKDAGYIRTVKSVDERGRWSTETHVYDRPQGTDIRETGEPESRTSERPAKTDISAGGTDVRETGSRKAVPRGEDRATGRAAGGTDVRLSDVRETGRPVSRRPVSRTSLSKTDHQGREDQDQEQPIANSQNRRVHDGPGDVADDAPLLGDDHAERPATDRNARASEPARFELAGCLDHPNQVPVISTDHRNDVPLLAATTYVEGTAAEAESDGQAGGVEDFEDHRRREQDRLMAWIREHESA